MKYQKTPLRGCGSNHDRCLLKPFLHAVIFSLLPLKHSARTALEKQNDKTETANNITRRHDVYYHRTLLFRLLITGPL
ncbi:hypothetical protein [Pantoea sp.]|uniref:hypothetical protein n=1 Tax=Pantoea sp. TaxID=69393 RepID=UPI0031D2F300